MPSWSPCEGCRAEGPWGRIGECRWPYTFLLLRPLRWEEPLLLLLLLLLFLLLFLPLLPLPLPLSLGLGRGGMGARAEVVSQKMTWS